MRRACAASVNVSMRIVLIIIPIVLLSCASTEFLVGKWEYDMNRTLAGLQSNENTPHQVVECFESGLCGKNLVFEYTNNEYRTIITAPGSSPLVSEYKPYQVLESDGQHIVIRAQSGSDVSVNTLTLIDKDNLSYEVAENGITWTEYWTRKH